MPYSEIKSGAILSYLSLFIGSCISIVYTPFMLRLLGQSEYGLLTLANSIVGYLSLLNLGLGSTMIRYISKYKAEGEKDKEYGLISLFLIIYLCISIIVIITGGILIYNTHYFFSDTLSPKEFNTLQTLMWLVTFNIFIGINSSVFYAIMMAYEKFIFTKVIGILNTIISPLIMLPLLLCGYKSIGITTASTLLNVINIFIIISYCFYKLKIHIKFIKFENSFLKELMSFSFFVFIAMLVDKVYWSTDQIILGAVSGTIAVAIYNIGATFTNYFMSFSTAITGLFLPKLTEMTTKHVSDKEFSELFIRVGRIQFFILGMVLGGFIVLGKQFIFLWAGREYQSSYYIALILLIPLIIPLIQSLGVQLMYARNLHKFRSIVLCIIAIINVILSIPLAHLYEGIGCALITGISYIIGQGLILNWFYYKKMNLDIITFWKEIGKIIIPFIIILIITAIIVYNLKCYDWKLFFISAIIFFFLYSAIMWKIAMNDFEKALILGYLRKSIK